MAIVAALATLVLHNLELSTLEVRRQGGFVVVAVELDLDLGRPVFLIVVGVTGVGHGGINAYGAIADLQRDRPAFQCIDRVRE